MSELIGTCLIMIGFIVGSVCLIPVKTKEKICVGLIFSVIIVIICTGAYLLSGGM